MDAIVMTRAGGNEVLAFRELADPTPERGQVVVDVSTVGVNFMDIGVREGRFWKEMPNPKILGAEGAGTVRAVGPGVEHFKAGQRVAWAYAPGSYANRIAVPETSLVRVPDGVDDRTAASLMLQGLTASHFATEFYPVRDGDTTLVHAAAGGVGTLLAQIIKLRGGMVIGRVSHASKIATAVAAGADHVIVDDEGCFATRVRELTHGEGVHAVFDGSGPQTFVDSVESLRPGGTFCWYGTALDDSGTIDLTRLPRSIKIGYAVFMDHIRTRVLLRSRAARLFKWVREGKLKVHVGQEYRLSEAARALGDLEGRRTIGKSVLIP